MATIQAVMAGTKLKPGYIISASTTIFVLTQIAVPSKIVLL
jgi:hypothetical protein